MRLNSEGGEVVFPWKHRKPVKSTARQDSICRWIHYISNTFYVFLPFIHGRQGHSKLNFITFVQSSTVYAYYALPLQVMRCCRLSGMRVSTETSALCCTAKTTRGRERQSAIQRLTWETLRLAPQNNSSFRFSF